MNATVKQAMIDTLAQKIAKSAIKAIPSGFSVKACKGNVKPWTKKRETIEFELTVQTPKGKASHQTAHSMLPAIESIMEAHHITGIVNPLYDRANNTVAFNCSL